MSKKTHAHRHSPHAVQRKHWMAGRTAWLGGSLILASIVAAILIFRPGTGVQTPSADQPSEIGVEQAYAEFQEGAFILDVRDQDEWDAFHIPGTTLIPLDQLQTRLEELPRDRRIVVVCRSGNRSKRGRDVLLEAGFTDVASMTGGLTAWSHAGYPIEGTRP
jgi:rhodanese-related sulfurtransferase